jgi:hypothetical protein
MNVMDEWQKPWIDQLEIIVDQVEQLMDEVVEEVSDAIATFFEISEEISTQVQTLFADEVEQYVTELVAPVLETYFGLGGVVEDISQPIFHTVDPYFGQQSICAGCRHFHGQVYGGTPLICGMHPYGMDAGVETCPDKELAPWAASPFESFFDGE